MGFLDQMKQALAKKRTAQHPDAETAQDVKTTKSAPKTPAGANKPPKKVTGRGR